MHAEMKKDEVEGKVGGRPIKTMGLFWKDLRS